MFKLAAAAAAAFVIASCSGNKAVLATADNMVPGDAVFAMKVNADQLWNKALGEEGSVVRNAWAAGKSMLAMQASQLGEMGEVASQVVNDPAALGVDLKQGLVLSVAGELTDIQTEEGVAHLYLVAMLNNSEAFVKVADAAVAFANAEGGLSAYKDVNESNYTHYVFMAEDGMSLDLGVSAESAVLRFMYNETVETTALAQSLTEVFAQESANSEGLEAFYKNDKDLAMWGDLEGVMTAYKPLIEALDPATASQLQAYMPMYEGASFISDLNFETGKTVIGFYSYGSKEFKEYAQKYKTASTDKFFSKLPESSFLVMNIAIKNFAGLVDELCTMSPEYADVFAELEESGMDKEFFEGFPGIITLAVDVKELSEEGLPRFAVFAECEQDVYVLAKSSFDAALYDYVNEELEFLADMHFGYEDGYMYLVYPSVAGGFDKNELAAAIENGGAVVDFAALPEFVLDELAREISDGLSGQDILPYMTSVVVVNSADFASATVTVNMGDKQHNLLEKIVLEAAMSMF